MALRSVNPATGELVREYPEAAAPEVAMILAEASCAFAGRRRTGFAGRAERGAAPAASARSGALEPLGPVLAVMPWNFPLWQVFRFAAPALMAGNAGLLKHAGNVSGAALAIEAIFKDAGFPPPLFRALLIPSEQVAKVIEAREVKAVTLTGSTPA